MMPVLRLLSRQLVVGREETCGSTGEELDGVVVELTAAAVVRCNVELVIFHLTLRFGCLSDEISFMVTHSV